MYLSHGSTLIIANFHVHVYCWSLHGSFWMESVLLINHLKKSLGLAIRFDQSESISEHFWLFYLSNLTNQTLISLIIQSKTETMQQHDCYMLALNAQISPSCINNNPNMLTMFIQSLLNICRLHSKLEDIIIYLTLLF